MSAVVLPAAISHFTSTQVIFSNSTRSVFAHGAAHAGAAVSISEAVLPAFNISKEFETEPIRMSLSVFRDNIYSEYYDVLQVIPQIHYCHNDVAVCARFWLLVGVEVLGVLRRIPCSTIYTPS